MAVGSLGLGAQTRDQAALDARVKRFLDERAGRWRDLNVPALNGPFDFVFSDADKDWYPNYFKAVFPKLTPGGCYATHNISERGRGRGTAGSREYLQLLRSTPGAETSVDERGGGMAITFKRTP
jgi:caffeoyl-CoA O-methyltransferase